MYIHEVTDAIARKLFDGIIEFLITSELRLFHASRKDSRSY